MVNAPVVSELSNFQRYYRDRADEIKAEFSKRRLKVNTGGVNNTKLMTAYREDALLLLECLSDLGGQATTRRLREITGIPKTTNILYDNYYGWFENVSRGVYKISEIGKEALDEYREAIPGLTSSLDSTNAAGKKV